ncbi:MAG: hypothetical protein KJZ65_06545 [Phycisphaerales bacterium]|nr:hypothetical protein [Phycisphaerales bacterium]
MATLAKHSAHEANLFTVRSLADRPGSAAIKSELCAFLRSLEPVATFHAVDFTKRLWRNGLVDATHAGIDLRCTGALWKVLTDAGVIRYVCHSPDGGNPYTNHNSARRPEYQLTNLAALERLNWENA